MSTAQNQLIQGGTVRRCYNLYIGLHLIVLPILLINYAINLFVKEVNQGLCWFNQLTFTYPAVQSIFRGVGLGCCTCHAMWSIGGRVGKSIEFLSGRLLRFHIHNLWFQSSYNGKTCSKPRLKKDHNKRSINAIKSLNN